MGSSAQVSVSAIVGVFRLNDQPVTRDEVAGMMAALAHRSGAGARSWCQGVVGLGYCGHHVPQESPRESQPAVDPASGVVLVADARVDNHAELVAGLGLDRRAGVSDAELLLHAYLKWGSECPRKVLGDFAFVVWDPRRNALFCARDVMGVKPLYYTRSGHLFAFATELKALLTLADVPRTLDDDQVALHLMLNQDDRTRTLYRAVDRLPAAHTLMVTGSRSTCTQYWQLDPARLVRFASAEEYVEAFRELLIDAVRVRLPRAGPVTAALSGGLDSSSIVCIARRLQGATPGTELHALSLVFPELSSEELRLIDERAYIEAVVAGGGLQAHAIRGDQLSPLEDFQRVLLHSDEPYFMPNLYLHWGLYRAAARTGAQVFLDGFDGDVAVGHGFGRLNGLARSGDWSAFEAEVRAYAQHSGRTPHFVLDHFGLPYLAELAREWRWLRWYRTGLQLAGRFGVSRRTIAFNYGVLPALSSWVKRVRRWAGKQEQANVSVLRPSWSRRLQAGVRKAKDPDPVLGEREAHRAGISQPLYQLTLETADKCAAAFGLEPRYPFFDRRIIEFCYALPDEQKFACGWPRYLLRRAMEGILPSGIQWRNSKGNLAPNFNRRFREADRPVVEATDYRSLEPYIEPQQLERIRQDYFAQESQTANDTVAQLLFRSTILAHWLDAQGSPKRATDQAGPQTNLAA